MKTTKYHLDILGQYQLEPCEFNKQGNFLGKIREHGQTADFCTQLAP